MCVVATAIDSGSVYTFAVLLHPRDTGGTATLAFFLPSTIPFLRGDEVTAFNRADMFSLFVFVIHQKSPKSIKNMNPIVILFAGCHGTPVKVDRLGTSIKCGSRKGTRGMSG